MLVLQDKAAIEKKGKLDVTKLLGHHRRYQFDMSHHRGCPISGAVPLPGTDVPSQGTDVPSQGTDVPSQGTDVSSQGTDVP